MTGRKTSSGLCWVRYTAVADPDLELRRGGKGGGGGGGGVGV